MSTDELLSILEDRGLRVVIGEDGAPRLQGDKSEASAKLLRVLKLPCHREEIVRRFRPKPRRQFLWRLGHTYTDLDDMPESWWPVGALWWRMEGEPDWKPIPERLGDEKTTAHEP